MDSNVLVLRWRLLLVALLPGELFFLCDKLSPALLKLFSLIGWVREV